MRFRLCRILYLCLVSHALALLVLPTGALAQDDSDQDNRSRRRNSDVRQSELPDPQFTPHGPFDGPLDISHIARFYNLPMRMHLEPHLISPGIVKYLDPRFVPLFDKTLREIDDAELLTTAALSLARVAREDLLDISGSSDILLKHLESHSDLRVRFACARALVDGDVSESSAAISGLEEHAEDSQRLWIDPALSRWRSKAAGEVWKKRLAASSETTIAVSLACDGLSALGDEQSSDLLLSIVHDELLVYEKRKAAARAICILAPDQAFAAAVALNGGHPLERLLAVDLLSSSRPEAHTELVSLCQDDSAGVAAAAWTALFRSNPGALIPVLPAGRSHRDAVVRMTAARTMRLFPDSERSVWLHEQLSDKHLEVRNTAREMSFFVAEEQPPLRDEIISMAGDALAENPENWQRVEQSLLLLGQLRATQFSDRCIPLLEHPRNEVLVTSAWLLHLFPDQAVEPAVRNHLMRNEGMLKTPALAPPGADIGLQSAYLIQYAGLMRLNDMQGLLEANFSKSAPGGVLKRAAAMWTLGLFHEQEMDSAPELAKSFLGRVADRAGMMPEQEEVRRMSAVALGLMRATTAVPGLLEAYQLDPPGSVIPDSARWSLGMTGEPLPDPVKPYSQSVGGWRLNPAGDL